MAASSAPPTADHRSIFQRLRPDPGALRLAGAPPDRWFVGADTPAETSTHGCVRFASDGEWLHGLAEIDDTASGGMQAAARRAYADVFEVLARGATPHLLRLWNYFPAINADGGGTERYRQFNVGRQQAFLDGGRSAFEGAPAACALGTSEGPLRVYFLAGRRPPRSIENPRQVSAYRYPEAYGPRSPTFSRAALAEIDASRMALFISGTASIVGHATLHAGDVRRQTVETFDNLAAVRAAAAGHAGRQFAASSLSYTVYLRHPSDLAAVRELFEDAVGVESLAASGALYLQADICRADLLVEIEAHGIFRRLDAR
jgi:chorismate lyase/3-hydroxybenzoate synthase